MITITVDDESHAKGLMTHPGVAETENIMNFI